MLMFLVVVVPQGAAAKEPPTQPERSLDAVARGAQAPGSKIAVDLSPSFVAADRFVGFWDDTRKISIVITDMPVGAYDQVSASMTPELMETRGFKGARAAMLGRVGPYIYRRATQSTPGGLVEKFILVFAAADGTALVAINVPTSLFDTGAVSDREFETVLASARFGGAAPPVEALASLADPGPLKLALTSGQTRIWTVDGKSGSAGATCPAIVLTVSTTFDAVEKPAQLAAAALMQLAGHKAIAIKGNPTVRTVAGRPAVELWAASEDEKTGEPRALYQVLIPLNSGGYVRFVGIAPAAERDQWFFQFRKSADTLSVNE
jgi:hypothetical protein